MPRVNFAGVGASSGGASSPAPVDGRAARAQRTREAIVDACVAMVEEGDLRPTAPRVAERAGVSVRSVFQHFDDLPTLYTALSRRVAERLGALLVPVDPALPVDARVAAFVAHRSALLEALTPFRRAAQVHGPFSPQVREAVAVGADVLRRDVSDTFSPELEAARAGGAEDDGELVAALAAVASGAMWDALRVEAGAAPEGASAAMARTLRALLADAERSAVSVTGRG
jgi:TetR/AcrR family transcriptional regulator, regulator of autoinduction and epiphytic fitness